MIAVLAFSYFMAVLFSKKPVTNTVGIGNSLNQIRLFPDG